MAISEYIIETEGLVRRFGDLVAVDAIDLRVPQQSVYAFLRSFPAEFGVTVFLSSHLLSEVQQTASHIGIINNGRLLFQGSLKDLEALRTHRIYLAVDKPEDAASVIREAGWQVTSRSDNQLVVESKEMVDGARINSMLVNNGFEVHRLSAENWSLESVFMELTSSPH